QSPIIVGYAAVDICDGAEETETPRANVTLKASVQQSKKVANEIMKYIPDQVVPYRQISSTRFVDVFPKSPASKILRCQFYD
ncbi:hypothetical protein K501DRAFT_144330, partial [Backusella circina FSU 941]